MGAAEKRIDTPWMTTEEAADYCRMGTKALLKHVERGHLRPDSWGKRGRTSTHRFRRTTLDRFLEGSSDGGEER